MNNILEIIDSRSLHFCLESLIAWAGTTPLDANIAALLCGRTLIYKYNYKRKRDKLLGAGRMEPERHSPSLALRLGAIPTLIRVQHNQPCAVPSRLILLAASTLAFGTGHHRDAYLRPLSLYYYTSP